MYKFRCLTGVALATALTLNSWPVLADHPDRDKGRGHSADEQGEKRGWVDGQPPGLAKKGAKGNKHKGKDKERELRHEHDHEHDRDRDDRDGHEHDEEIADTEPDHVPESSPVTLRDIAKGEAARAAGAKAGSAEEALIHIGTDAVLDRASQY